MRAFTVYWNQLTDVTQIKYNQSFPDWSYMEKVDVLQDAIAELSEMQQSIMDRQSALDREKNTLYKKEWVGLTDEEVWHMSQYNCGTRGEFARAIEAKLKEKNYD